MNLSKKAMSINPSITLCITAKAKELKEAGIDVVSFGAGEPDFNTPDNIINGAIDAMNSGNTKYTQTSGILELRKAICNKFKNDNELSYTPNQIIVSTGAKQCLANAFMAILNPGDEVLIPKPYWVSYPELIKLADGVPVYVETSEECNYKYTIKALEEVVNSKTKAILLNSPNNPTGTIYNKCELEQIAKFAKKYDLIIISDEIYEKLIYDNNKHISIASISEDSFSRTIVINGMSKSYAMTGWRVGYAAAPVEIINVMISIQSHVTSNANSITQYAALEALTGSQDTILSMLIEFEKRRNFMIERLSDMGGIKFIKPNGAFYIMINIEEFFNRELRGKKINSSLDFSELLLEEEKVAVIPGEAFGLDKYIRLSYATSMELIDKGLFRIGEFIQKLS